jgi:hypothetical protein
MPVDPLRRRELMGAQRLATRGFRPHTHHRATIPPMTTPPPEDQRDDPRHTFSARSYDWRLHSAPDAIERQLATEVARAGSKRAFVVCSPSIAAKTNTIDRIAETLGDRYAGTFDAIEVDSTYRSVGATYTSRASPSYATEIGPENSSAAS